MTCFVKALHPHLFFLFFKFLSFPKVLCFYHLFVYLFIYFILHVSNVNCSFAVTPLKHKLRGRKRGVSGCPPPKSQGFKGLGKRRSKNIDDDDDGTSRPGKRSCTMKTTVSPQPSPTLIECPEPGCDKKYKHINGLRYHQAHAHLEEVSTFTDKLILCLYKPDNFSTMVVYVW